MVEVQNLVKHFGHIKAVDGVSFRVERGEVLGFLGPNGAGKSTTMKMLTCFIPPTSGTATVKGFSILDNPIQVREQLGYLPESAPIYEDMTVQAFLAFIAGVRGFSGPEAQRKVDRVYEICGLKPVRHQTIHTLSKGFRQRVCFAQAILHDPEVLILDEPTDGLDPNQKHVVRNLIRDMAKGKTIILSTHILEEVDAVCSRVIIISSGTVKFDGTPADLRARSVLHNTVSFTVPAKAAEALQPALKAVPGVARVECAAAGDVVRVSCQPEKGRSVAVPVAALLKGRDVEPLDFIVERGKLDEVFRGITQGQQAN